MSKDLFHRIRECDLIEESHKEPLDSHLKVLYLRQFNQVINFKQQTK